jgi:hypothetical protein
VPEQDLRVRVPHPRGDRLRRNAERVHNAGHRPAQAVQVHERQTRILK